MEWIRKVSLSMVAVFLIFMIVAGVLLHYPLNLIVDGIALAVVGVASIVYIIIWSFLDDRVIFCRNHFTVLSRRFPFWTTIERRVYFKEISYFVDHGTDTIIVLKSGDIIHINRSETDEGKTIHDLPDLMRERRVRESDHREFIKKRVGNKKSDLTKI